MKVSPTGCFASRPPRRLGALLSALSVAAALSLPGCGAPAETPTDLSRRVDALFAPLTLGIQPGAAVLVVGDGQVVHEAGYGYADLERRLPITPRSAFNLASVSKQFTAMGVILLAADGKLAYDDPVSRYLPALAPYEGLTIRHLMTHTGGLPEYYEVIDTSVRRPGNADAVTLLAQMRSPVFPPGARYEYSNPGYDVLAPLVEAVSGMPFAAFMRERIFLPVGMQDARIWDDADRDFPGRVMGYAPDGEGYVENDDHPLNAIVGSGSMYASLRDFFHWDQALYGERLVKRTALDEAFRAAALASGELIDYGFGWRIDEYEGRRRLRHGGSWVGFRTHIARYPDERFTIVILSNRRDFNPEEYIDPITDIWLGGGPDS